MAAPVVASTVPTTGATDVDPRNSLTATFSTALSTTSVTRSTVVLYQTDSGRSVDLDVSLSSDLLTITAIPRQVLREEVNYSFTLMGADVGSPGGSIESSGGDPLVTTYSATFRTAAERFVSLEEITDRNDIERVGPIRSIEDEAEEAGYLAAVDVTPDAFATNQDRSLSQIVVDFGETVQATGAGPALEVSITPADGYIRNYGQEDVTGKFLWREVEEGVPSRFALFTDPTGAVSFSGDTVIWTRDSSFTWPYNAEVTVKAEADYITNATGEQLEEDLYFTFTTEYWPMYGSATVMRIELGPLIRDMYDDTINRIVFTNSVESILHADWSFDVDYPYPNVERYVKAQSIIDIIDELRLLGDIQADQQKTLGDFTVRYGGGSNPMLIAKRAEAIKERDRALYELRHYRGQKNPRTTVQSRNYASERKDFNMRTYDSLVYSGLPLGNVAEDRSAKAGLRTDHPKLSAGQSKRVWVSEGEEILVQGDGIVRVQQW